jgi:hypothetical protein
MQLDDFVTAVQQALAERLRSIVLFGSAATGDFVEGVSQYDLLIVLDRLSPGDLAALGPAIRRWHKAGRPLPLLFTPERLAASTDAFAMEFLDLQQSRRVLQGDDPFAALDIDPAHVRMHLERELRGKALALRDRYVLAADHSGRIADLLTDSLSTFLSLFRTALRLYQPEVPAQKLDAMHALAKYISFDPQPFVRVEELKEGRVRHRDIDTSELFARYSEAIEVVCDAVDSRT